VGASTWVEQASPDKTHALLKTKDSERIDDLLEFRRCSGHE
jgi:hypothetical protein